MNHEKLCVQQVHKITKSSRRKNFVYFQFCARGPKSKAQTVTSTQALLLNTTHVQK